MKSWPFENEQITIKYKTNLNLLIILIISSFSAVKIFATKTTLDPVNLHKNLQIIKEKKIEDVILEASSHGLKQSRLDSIKFNTAIFNYID